MAENLWGRMVKSVFGRMGKRFRNAEERHPEWMYSNVPVPDDLIEEFDVVFTGRDGNSLTADIYRPAEPPEDKLPVIILLHGGGLVGGRPVMERGAAELLARKGYIVYVPGYRMMNEADLCGEVSDVCAAMDFAADTLAERGGDPDRVFLIAESAGALLGLYAAVMGALPRLQTLMSCVAPKLSFKATCFGSGMFYTTKKDIVGISYPYVIYPEQRGNEEFMRYMDTENPEIMAALPPAIMTTSRNDFLRNYTLRYHDALIRAGADSSLIYYALRNRELGHAFITMDPELPQSVEAFDIICRWFEDHSK